MWRRRSNSPGLLRIVQNRCSRQTERIETAAANSVDTQWRETEGERAKRMAKILADRDIKRIVGRVLVDADESRYLSSLCSRLIVMSRLTSLMVNATRIVRGLRIATSAQ